MARKLKKILKKAAPLLAIAGLGKAFMNARNNRNQPLVPKFMGAGLDAASMPRKDFISGDAMTAENIANFDRGMSRIAAAGGVANLKTGGMVVKTGEEPKKRKKKIGIQIRGFGKARK